MRRFLNLIGLLTLLAFAAACTAQPPGNVTGNISGNVTLNATGSPAGNATGNGTGNVTENILFVSFSRDIQPIFDQRCALCHTGNATKDSAGLELSANYSYSSMVNVYSVQSPLRMVAPGSPENSYLVAKLTDNHLAVGGSGVRMPPGPPLPQLEIDTIRQWILEGAQDN